MSKHLPTLPKARRLAVLRNILRNVYTGRCRTGRSSTTKSPRCTSSLKLRHGSIPPSLSQILALYDIDRAERIALLSNNHADFEIRVIPREKVNEIRRRGSNVHILGDITRISQREMLAKAKKFAPVSRICVKEPTFFIPPIKYEYEESIKVIEQRKEPVKVLARIGGCIDEAPAISSNNDIHEVSRSQDVKNNCGSGTTQNFSFHLVMEKMVYVMIEERKKEIAEEKREIRQKEQSLERQKIELEEKEKKLNEFTEMYHTVQKMNDGKATDEEAAEKLKQVSLPNDDKKLLCEKFEESRLMATMLDATEQFLGPEHLRVEETTRWSDYHVAICLQYYLHINKYGNPSLLYGLRSKYFNYFKSETKFKTLRSYRQYCDVMRQLTENEFDRLILDGIGVDKNTTIGRTSLRQWYNTYWQLSEIFKKHIYLPPSKEKQQKNNIEIR